MKRSWYFALSFFVLAALGGGLYHTLTAHEPQRDFAAQARVIDVFKRNYEQLIQHPDVLGVSHWDGKIIIATDRPHAVPKYIEGVPVEVVEPEPHLPPPPGVILMKDDGKPDPRPDLNDCPPHYVEKKIYRWRFCRKPDNHHPIPNYLMFPPIAGVPYQEAVEIVKRNRKWVMATPGVMSMGLGADGIHIRTSNPELLPSTIEGLPVWFFEPDGVPQVLNHSAYFPVAPMGGAVAARDPARGGYATAGGIVLSEGKPWILFPGHAIENCEFVPYTADPYNEGPLNKCSHTHSNLLEHPPLSSPVMIARVSKWTQFAEGGSTTKDIAAGFLDNDYVEGNGSRPVRRENLFDYQYPFPGTEAFLPINAPLRIASAIDSYTDPQGNTFTNFHTYLATVTSTFDSVTTRQPCLSGAPSYHYTDVFRYQVNNGSLVLPGSSGALIMHALTHDVLGINTLGLASSSTGDPLPTGWGTQIDIAHNYLKYDSLYGSATINDNAFGTWRPGNGVWYLDNGDGKPVAGDPHEIRITYGGGAYGDIPVTGVWVQNGPRCPGVFRGPEGRWYLDHDCNGATNQTVLLGTNGDLPVAGDWNGDGVTDLGVYRPSTTRMYLDDGDRVWEGCNDGSPPGPEKCFNYGLASDKPVAGDWNGSGFQKTGLWRASNGTWYLELGNNGWQGCGTEWCPGPFGQADDKPFAGNWTGATNPSGIMKDKVGVYDDTGIPGITGPYYFILDNGNGLFDNYQREQRYGPYGTTGDMPVVWRRTERKSN